MSVLQFLRVQLRDLDHVVIDFGFEPQAM